jgi:methylated-DNA-[protein]-cysteine S-methyltransferase
MQRENHAVARCRVLETPTGPFAIVRNADGSIETLWVNDAPSRRRIAACAESPRLLPELSARLEAYFRGEAVHFDDVPLPAGGAYFRACWAACRAIPRGETRSYAELAAAAGASPSAARAAGQAMRRNPLPIITPCHRVVGSSGSLHGFAGHTESRSRALGIKRTLLEIEAGAKAAAGPPSPRRSPRRRAPALAR